MASKVLSIETSSLLNQCERLQEEVSQLNIEVLTTRTSRIKFQTRCQTLENKEKELESSLLTTKDELAASKKKVKEHEITISDQRRKLKNETQNLHSETSAKNVAVGSVTRLDTLCKKQEAELVRLKKEVAQLEAKKSELVNNLSAETEKVTELETVLRESGKQSEVFKHESQKKDEEITLLKQKGEETEAQLTLKLSQVEEQRDLAQGKLGDLERASENSRKDFQVKVQELQEQLDELKHDRSTLQFKLQQTQSDYAIEQKICDRERDTTKGLRTEIAQLKGSLSSLNADLKAKDNRIASLNQECSAAKAALGEQLSEAQSKLKMLESANEELQDNYDKQATTLGDLRLQLGDLQDLHRNLEEERSNYEDRIKQLQEANQASSEERINLSDQLKEEKAKYEQIVEELNRQKDDMKNTHESSEEMLQKEKMKDKQAWDEKKHELERKVATLQLGLAAYQEEYEKLDRQYKEVVKNGKENIQLTEKLKDAEASHEKAMAMHHTATKEKEELSRKVEELVRKKVELTKTVASNESELNHTSTELTSTLAELSNTHDGLKKAQEQNEASSSRCQKLEQQCQELRQHIAELESVQNRLQKREEDLNQQVDILKSERDTAQRQAQDFDRDGRDLKLKLQKTQSDYENEQENCDRERDTTQGLRTEISQLFGQISSLEREVQALKDKGSHRREVMQQVVKLLQAQVAAVRSDLDQERSRQSDLKDSVEQLLTRSYIARSLKTELVSRAAELHKCRDKLQKCRDELKTTTAERDKLNQSETSAASQVSMQQQLHQFQEHVTQSLGQVHDRVAKVAADVSAVPELNRGVQQLHRQMSSSSSLDQSSMSGQQLTSRSQKLESAIDSDEHLDPDLMTSDASSDVPITGQQWTLSSARLQPTPEEDTGLETVTSIVSDLPDNGNGHHQLSPDSSPSSVDPHTTEVTASPTEERDLVADLSRPTGPDHEMRTNSPDVSRMDRQPAISHYSQPSTSDHHQRSVRNRHQPSISDCHQPSVNDRDPQSFRDHPPRPWSEDNMDPLPINGPNPSLPTRIAGQRTHFSNVASYSTFSFQTNPMSLGGRFHWVPVPMSFPTTSVMPSHDDPSPMSLPSSSASSFPMHGGRDSSLSATVATSLQNSVDPAVLREELKLPRLMPYVRSLSPVGCMIAGHLNMQTEWDIQELATNDPVVRLQKLLSQWLEGREDEERPHNWGYFIKLVKAVDQYQVARRICTDLTAGQAKS